jgi:hypothetical protein
MISSQKNDTFFYDGAVAAGMMRPEDVDCPKCGMPNEYVMGSCRRCGEPRPEPKDRKDQRPKENAKLLHTAIRS